MFHLKLCLAFGKCIDVFIKSHGPIMIRPTEFSRHYAPDPTAGVFLSNKLLLLLLRKGLHCLVRLPQETATMTLTI